MNHDSCPVPSKKPRSSDVSDNEDLNLSPSFNETYKILMKEEMVAICSKQFNFTDDVEVLNDLSEFLRKCDDFQIWINTVLNQRKRQSLCRCDFYLDKICQRRQLLQSSRFLNMKIISQVLVSEQPQHSATVNSKIEGIEKQLHSSDIFADQAICHVLEDINEDITDLWAWLNDVKQKLNFDITSSNRKQDMEVIEYMLRDFEIHNEISISVIRLLNELHDHDPPLISYDRVTICKSDMDSLERTMYQEWLNAIEYKLRLEGGTHEAYLPGRMIGPIGHESGFESELSPMYNARKLCRVSNPQIMKYISSGDDDTNDGTTELPSDSQSADMSIDRVPYRSYSIGTMAQESSQITATTSLNLTSPKKRIIRRKKRRSKRRDKADQCNLSTEESESCWKSNDKSSLKRRIHECSNQLAGIQTNSGYGLNYLEIADAAERLVRKNSAQTGYVTYESPKESEVEDHNDTKTGVNDIDVEKNWDYYQASMYSNEEGDSQMIEVDNIKDWEPDLETDCVEVVPVAGNSPPKMYEKRLSILTSGYETSLECDRTICSKGLISVLQFTRDHCQEVDQRLRDLFDNAGKMCHSPIDSRLASVNECSAIADMHLRLLSQIIDHDPCAIAHSTTLVDNLKVMLDRWQRLKDHCVGRQLDLAEDRMRSLDQYEDVEGLKGCIEGLEGLETMLVDMNAIHRPPCTVSASLVHRIQDVCDRVVARKETRRAEVEVVMRCLSCVAQSKCTRRLLACQWQLSSTAEDVPRTDLNDIKDIYDKFEKCIISLKKCMDDVGTVTSNDCQVYVSNVIDQEIKSWKKLCDRVSPCLLCPYSTMTAEQIDTLNLNQDTPQIDNTSCCSRLRNLPFPMAIIVVVAMIGWWYSQLSNSDCHSTSSNDWMRLLFRYRDRMEPH